MTEVLCDRVDSEESEIWVCGGVDCDKRVEQSLEMDVLRGDEFDERWEIGVLGGGRKS